MFKKIVIAFILIFSMGMFSGCSLNASNDVVRIHIRANSNSVGDQNVKLKVRDEVIKFITPIISECENSDEVKKSLSDNIGGIEKIADKILYENGYNYTSSASIRNEYFPSRDYDGSTFPADYYDALIINLGSGSGDNWWCVAYPPLCFVGKNNGSGEIKYRSKILDLINKYFGG